MRRDQTVGILEIFTDVLWQGISQWRIPFALFEKKFICHSFSLESQNSACLFRVL
jgi:hypothetical protein